jgi:hypothetical protein
LYFGKFSYLKKRLLVANENEEREGGNLIYILELELLLVLVFPKCSKKLASFHEITSNLKSSFCR